MVSPTKICGRHGAPAGDLHHARRGHRRGRHGFRRSGHAAFCRRDLLGADAVGADRGGVHGDGSHGVRLFSSGRSALFQAARPPPCRLGLRSPGCARRPPPRERPTADQHQRQWPCSSPRSGSLAQLAQRDVWAPDHGRRRTRRPRRHRPPRPFAVDPAARRRRRQARRPARGPQQHVAGSQRDQHQHPVVDNEFHTDPFHPSAFRRGGNRNAAECQTARPPGLRTTGPVPNPAPSPCKADPDPPRRIHLEPREPLHRLDRRGPDPLGIAQAGRPDGCSRPRAGTSTWPTPACSSAPRARCGTCLDEMDRTWLPVVHSWRLNERHYGALQGLNKADMARQYGDAQVLVWRRSYDTPPPALEPTDPAQKRGDIATPAGPGQVPLTECLGTPVARVLPFWNDTHRAGHPRRPAGGDRPRQLDPRAGQVPGWHRRRHRGLNIPNGIPLVYELDAVAPDPPLLPGRREAAAAAAAAVTRAGPEAVKTGVLSLQGPGSGTPARGRVQGILRCPPQR